MPRVSLSPCTVPFAQLGKIRSVGITDLRHGNQLDEDWQAPDCFAPLANARASMLLPEGVQCDAIATTTGQQASNLSDRLVGDGLAPPA